MRRVRWFARAVFFAVVVALQTECAVAAEAARTVSLPRLHEGALMGLGAVIIVAGMFSLLRRGR